VTLAVARIIVAVVFAAAAFAKLASLPATRSAIEAFGVPKRVAAAGTYVLPLAELAVALLVLWSSTAWWGSLGALVLLASFSVAIGVNLAQGRTPDCHCFGQLHSRPVSAGTLGRNGVLAVPPLFVLAAGRVDAGPDPMEWLRHLSRGEAVLTVVCAALAAALAFVAIVLRRVVARQRELAEAVNVLEQHALRERPPSQPRTADPPRGLPLGAVAPDALVTERDGERLTISTLLDRRPAVLIFVSHGCAPCRQLLPRLPGWQRKLAGRVRIAVIVRGSEAAHAKVGEEHPEVELHFSRGEALSTAYRAEWTPAAVAISPEGRVASETRFGPEAIEELLASAGDGAALPGTLESKLGTPAPSFTAVDDTGQTVTNAIFGGGMTALLYWSSSCRYCVAMAGDLTRWASEPPLSAPRLVIITSGREPLPERFGAVSVVPDADGEVARVFGFTGTPSSLLVDGDGALASSVCAGAEDVKLLLGVVPARPREDSAQKNQVVTV
jgi:thiol-disulfide isomerase/thioredoxin